MNLINETIQTVKNWWVFVLLGISMIFFGIFVFITPAESYLTLSILFSMIVSINGVLEISFAISNRKSVDGYGWYLAGGIGKTIIGIILMIYPGITASILPVIVGFWLMLGAISLIAGALDLKSFDIKGWGWILFAGILLSIFSFFVIIDPIFGSGVVVAMTSLALITYGVSYTVYGTKLRKINGAAEDVEEAALSELNDLKEQIVQA